MLREPVTAAPAAIAPTNVRRDIELVSIRRFSFWRVMVSPPQV
jgi:hypothetical protein